eukprot:c16369_g2_i1 orf=44-238(+)
MSSTKVWVTHLVAAAAALLLLAASPILADNVEAAQYSYTYTSPPLYKYVSPPPPPPYKYVSPPP